VAASVWVSPAESSAALTTPLTMIAPESQGQIAMLNAISQIPGGESIARAKRRTRATPTPAPQRSNSRRLWDRSSQEALSQCRNAEGFD